MLACDVLVVGGGPAGSTCAWKLRQAGVDVLVMDRAIFPRDKVCAGWITPGVVADLRLDLEAYRHCRTLQVIDGFHVGVIGDEKTATIAYGRPVSFGIRRCEFDDFLLQRSGARLLLGTSVTEVRRDGTDWVINGEIRTPMLVGAGGHFCPIARWLNGANGAGAPLVVAREAEYESPAPKRDAGTTGSDWPELFFCRDLKGYGWCVRKQDYVNVGLGRADQHSLSAATAEFLAFLGARGRVVVDACRPLRGHAYLLRARSHRRVLDEGVLLIGDAAGLAYPQSGEGIRPAVESGMLAARMVVEAAGRYTRSSLEAYEAQTFAGAETPVATRILSSVWSSSPGLALARSLLRAPVFVRNVVLNQWFLRGVA